MPYIDDVFVGLKVRQGYAIPETCDEEKLKLAVQNANNRDSCIYFDEGPHKYYVQGENYVSTTTFIHGFFDEFDAFGAARNIVMHKQFETLPKYSEYRELRNTLKRKHGQAFDSGLLTQAIQNKWQDNGATQSALGTKMHRQIEVYYNDQGLPESPTREFEFFLNFHTYAMENGWRRFRTEMLVWDRETKLCGSIDMVYMVTEPISRGLLCLLFGKDVASVILAFMTQEVVLADWKRSRKIEMENPYNKWGKPPCAHMPDTNYSHYTLQLNLYKYLLEKNYGVSVIKMMNVVCHPDNENYLVYEIQDVSPTLKLMLDERKKAIANKGTC